MSLIPDNFKIGSGIKRIPVRVVSVGEIELGGQNPIRIQSMTNTPLADVELTVKQVLQLWEAGCEMVRIAVPSIKEVTLLEEAKKRIRKNNCPVPLIADVHFNADIADAVVPFVEKVRINPGNYAVLKKHSQVLSEEDKYLYEIDFIRQRLKKLTDLCRINGTAIRIGTNHGSLSDRILQQYGNTPKAMVVSAMEFVKIFEDLGFKNLVLSMKASNPRLMIDASRMLMHEMILSGNTYPVHLGVTEAGNATEGRIKSALGIGTLLGEGIGDTIRVSLAENPLAEIPVARKIADIFNPFFIENQEKDTSFEYRLLPEEISFHQHTPPVVIADLTDIKDGNPKYALKELHGLVKNQQPDFILLDKEINKSCPDHLKYIIPYSIWKRKPQTAYVFPYYFPDEFNSKVVDFSFLNFLIVDKHSIEEVIKLERQYLQNTTLLIHAENITSGICRNMISFLRDHQIDRPVVLWLHYFEKDQEMLMIKSAMDGGGLLADYKADGICISAFKSPGNRYLITEVTSLGFEILQASKRKITKTEYIICPSCGRTLFDFEKLAREVKSRTSHLTGLKIAVMGCIVNGPGEMGDADYGFVGSGKDQVALYRGKDMIRNKISLATATNELINLIRSDGKWLDQKPN